MKKKIEKIVANLKLMRTLRLVWSIARAGFLLTVLMILIENSLFLLMAYLFKKLINILAQGVYTPDKTHLIFSYLIETFIVALCYVIAKSISSFISELQASKVSEYIDDKIHASAINLDMAFYESPEYFNTLKRARDEGADRPNAIVTV